MAFTTHTTDDEDEQSENDHLLNKKNKKQREGDAETNGWEGSASNWEKISQAVRKRLKKDGLRLILLIILNGFYLYFGGLIFYLLEKQPDIIFDERKHVEMLLNSFVKDTSVDIRKLHKNDDVSKIVANISSADISEISATILKIHDELSSTEGDKWSITSAVFFASTVVTTIGYGNIAPVTTAGRWFCVGYAIVGIPLTVMLLALVGRIISKYINHACGFIVKTMRRYLYAKYEYDRVEENTELQAPVWLALLFMILVTSIFAGMFMKMENWSFSKSLYFIFITFTTIGFGDIVPHNQKAVWFNVTFLYLGLAAISITINLVIANITFQYRKHKEKIRIVQKLEEELDDSDVDENKDGDVNCGIENNNTMELKKIDRGTGEENNNSVHHGL